MMSQEQCEIKSKYNATFIRLWIYCVNLNIEQEDVLRTVFMRLI